MKIKKQLIIFSLVFILSIMLVGCFNLSKDIPDTFTLTTKVIEGEGSINKQPNKEKYEKGVKVVIDAIPSDGWRFDSWTNSLESTDKRTTITITEDMIIGAKFIKVISNKTQITNQINKWAKTWETKDTDYFREIIVSDGLELSYYFNNKLVTYNFNIDEYITHVTEQSEFAELWDVVEYSYIEINSIDISQGTAVVEVNWICEVGNEKVEYSVTATLIETEENWLISVLEIDTSY